MIFRAGIIAAAGSVAPPVSNNITPTITDAFTRANASTPGGDWTADTPGGAETWSISSNTLVPDSAGATITCRNGVTALSSQTQFARVKFVTLGDSAKSATSGFVFRMTGDTGYRYFVYYSPNSTPANSAWAISSYNALSWVEEGTPVTQQITAGDVIGCTFAGTTTVTARIWINPTQTGPVDVSNWDAASDPCDITLTLTPTNQASGTYVGLGAYMTSAAGTNTVFDDFYAGAI